MDVKGKLLRANQKIPSQPRGTGRVREFRVGRDRRLFQITTFCPELVGPGPTHVYLLEDDALILVDTGLPTVFAKNLFYFWRRQPCPDDIAALADDHAENELLSAIELCGHDVSELDYIVLTHGHPDHYAMGRMLVGRSGARVVAHACDAARIANPWWILEFWVKRFKAITAMGMPLPESAEQAPPSTDIGSTDMSLRVDIPVGFDGSLVLDGMRKDFIEVVHTPGHSEGSMSLLVYDDERKRAAMLCGDTLLFPTTPHPDDLIAYLRTLKRIRTLQNVAITLPAHGDRIAKLHQRLDALEKHHQRRLQMTFEACRRPRSIWQIATLPRYFDVTVDPAKFNPLAGQEAYIHVELLQLVGGVETSRIEGGVHYFQCSGEKFEAVYARVLELVADESRTALLRR
jgi:glyoxylase-like metal-dependent hydrolase (beta-lactamase superfamily II)